MAQSTLEICSELNSKAATRLGVDGTTDVFGRVRSAFAAFDSQSSVLQAAFDNLKKNLAAANTELQAKNSVLAEKVLELQQMSSRLRGILTSISDGVLVVNADLVIEHCNPAAQAVIGPQKGNVVHRQYHEVMNGLGNQDALMDAIVSGRTRMHEQRSCTREDGSRIHVLASVSPMRMLDGEVFGAVEVLQDVTHLRLLEERMQHQKRMAALGEMAASVAHEIRNPLGTIEGFARLLRQDLDREKQTSHSRMASKIIEGTQNLNYVITSLMTYVRPMALQCAPFDVATLLESTEELLVGLARQTGVKLNVSKQAGIVPSADIRQIRQVLVNLGRNAIEACAPSGGEVAILCRLCASEVVFDVIDNGCGIMDEDLPHLFDPFFTRKEGGLGLGLAMSHKMVAAHGGEIMFGRREGQSGTVATVRLPQMGDGE
ncbi:MAG: ATP-binding protein [bacterium]